MEKGKITLVLANDTRLEGLTQNGNNLISPTEVKESDLKGHLAPVTIEYEDGSTEVHEHMELVQIVKDDGDWWIALRDLTKEEIENAALRSQLEDANNAVAELSELVASLM